MSLQWVLFLALATTIIAAEKAEYDETGNDLLRWLDNSGRGFGTWRSPPEEEDRELEYSGHLFKNGEYILKVAIKKVIISMGHGIYKKKTLLKEFHHISSLLDIS